MIAQLLEGWIEPDELDNIFEWCNAPWLSTPYLYLSGSVYKEKIKGRIFISICVETDDSEGK